MGSDSYRVCCRRSQRLVIPMPKPSRVTSILRQTRRLSGGVSLNAVTSIPGLVGYWKSDPQYLFEDSAGTTPASTSGTGPVGQWRAVGANPALTTVTVANSGFDADSDWTKGTGWSIGSGVATKTPGSASSISQTVSLTPGVQYLITWTMTRSAGTFTPQFKGGTTVAGTSLNTSGTFTENLVAVTGNTTLDLFCDGNFAGTIDDVSVVAVSGLVAVESTTANKPILRKTPTTGVYWADSNTSTSALDVALGNLGSACTVARSGAEGVTFTEGVTISSTYNLAPAFSFNSDVALFNRALTATEKALVTRYMQRGVPVLGSNSLSLNLDSAAWGSIGTVSGITATGFTSTGTGGRRTTSELAMEKHYLFKESFSKTGSAQNSIRCGVDIASSTATSGTISGIGYPVTATIGVYLRLSATDTLTISSLSAQELL